MTSSTVEQKLADQLVDGGHLVTSGRELVMEVMDLQAGLVWMSTEPVTQTYFDELELEEGLVKVGIASASMDCAGFQHSPGRGDEPVLQRVIDGRTYINVARPMDQSAPDQPGGPTEIQVDKTHVIGFEAGRSVAILKLPEGNFVEVVGDQSVDGALVLPKDGELTSIELDQPWIVALPSPTRTFFWFEKGMRSFQGPVDLP